MPAFQPDDSNHPDNNLSVIILAGGQSRRMGIDKSLLPLGGVTIVERLYELLSSVSDDVMVVTDPANIDRYVGLHSRVIDEMPGQGPLGGLASGLKAARHEYAFLIGSVMPFVEPDLVLSMAEAARGYQACVPVLTTRGMNWQLTYRTEPLHAVYSKEALLVISSALKQGMRQIDKVLPLLFVRYLSDTFVSRYAPPEKVFFNVKTPKDYERALEIFRDAPV